MATVLFVCIQNAGRSQMSQALFERALDWDLTAPKGKSLDEVRVIRDDIERRTRQLLDELGG